MNELSIETTLERLRAGQVRDSPRLKDGIDNLILEYEFAEDFPNGRREDDPVVQARLRKLLSDVDDLRRYELATAGLRDDLAELGFVIEDVRELERPEVGNVRALPVLTRWLPLLSEEGARFAVVLALHGDWVTTEAIDPLMGELQRLKIVGAPNPDGFAWQYGIVSALCALIVQSRFELLVAIAKEPANAAGRMLAISALEKFRKRRPEIIEFLLEFINSSDPTVYVPAAQIFAAWKVHDATPRIRYLLDPVEERPPPPGAQFPEELKRNERSELKSALRKLAT